MDLPRVRLDGGGKAFRRRWGYDLVPPPTLLEEEEEDEDLDEDIFPDPSSENSENTSVRGLHHYTSPLGELQFNVTA